MNIFGVNVSAVGGCDDGSRGLVLVFRPRTDIELGAEHRHSGDGGNIHGHEDAGMPAESLLEKRPYHLSGFMRQELRLDAMDSGRLLKGFDHVRKQPFLHFLTVGGAASIANEEIANDTFALFINEKRISKNITALDGSVTGQDF